MSKEAKLRRLNVSAGLKLGEEKMRFNRFAATVRSFLNNPETMPLTVSPSSRLEPEVIETAHLQRCRTSNSHGFTKDTEAQEPSWPQNMPSLKASESCDSICAARARGVKQPGTSNKDDELSCTLLTDHHRSFLKKAYPTMKRHNPNIPILIREAVGVEPKVWARYGLGREKSESLSGLSDKEIEEKITTLVKSD
ncbi:hypothetical protein LTR99_001605 [Exophiala xenobiotica]|uniref:Ribosomal protein/NADH dehydrogenase domain-containing protein n=1 Tax=Vermiconidia calcicola TaxID=1690605 RepID=A0AAV9QIE7_9PEZI|nr:hypothetical protein LTR99_001605 [Exophiala xenobiotica]KAK5438131.1 hypothetical protein LTR34_001679 [Exophiala xenobiotica]KAK5544114.1 hypothetical protein LTR25_001729 [Vermiconidia calcicola]KAK5547606.1 hypothetical protein LTR23_002359 [Chaetothyriales sp. CCFEE 6169]